MSLKRREENKLIKFKNLWEGSILPSKNFGNFKVVEYINTKNLIVQFLNTGNIVKTTTTDAKLGYVKDKEIFKVLGVGINDVGRTLDENGKTLRSYQLWLGVLKRSHCDKFKNSNKTYLDVCCHKSWLRYSVFLSDIENMVGYKNTDWHLDKDFLSKGNKIYSKETCCFVPREINNILTKRQICRGKYPIGVTLHKKTCKFVSTISIEGISNYIGSFDCPNKAFQAYKKAKESFIKEVAEKWKGKIDNRVYQTLLNYEVSIDD